MHLLTPMPLKVARRRLALPRLLDSESSGSAILREPPGVNWLQGQGSAPCVGRVYEALSGLLQSPCVKNTKMAHQAGIAPASPPLQGGANLSQLLAVG